MQIRRLLPADAAAYQALRLATLHDEPWALAASHEEEKDTPLDVVAQRLAPKADHGFIGAFEGEQLVGMVALGREGMAKLAHKAYIWGMVVAPAWRRRGVARALMNQMLGFASSMPGLRQVNLCVNTRNDAARRLYESLGFAVWGHERGSMMVDGELHDEFHMCLQLRETATGNRATELKETSMLTIDDPLVLRHADARGVVTLTLNRPQAFNSLSEAMLTALQTELTALAHDESARVVVLAASGKAFCAGHDLKEMRAEPSAEYYRKLFAKCAKLMLAIQRLPLPVVAQVQGIATAAGCQLVAMCDLAVAASTARFAVSGVSLGLFCSTPAVALSRNLGRKSAFEMLVTGEFISADEARQKGLVNRVAEPDQLAEAVEKLVASIVAKPRVAVAMGKALFYRQLESGIEAAYTDAGQTMACNMMDEAALEGVQAFIDKRPPNWGGKGAA